MEGLGLARTKIAGNPYPGRVLGDYRSGPGAALYEGVLGLAVQDGQDSAGIWTAPSGAQIVWFHDPDENVLSLAAAKATIDARDMSR